MPLLVDSAANSHSRHDTSEKRQMPLLIGPLLQRSPAGTPDFWTVREHVSEQRKLSCPLQDEYEEGLSPEAAGHR